MCECAYDSEGGGKVIQQFVIGRVWYIRKVTRTQSYIRTRGILDKGVGSGMCFVTDDYMGSYSTLSKQTVYRSFLPSFRRRKIRDHFRENGPKCSTESRQPST